MLKWARWLHNPLISDLCYSLVALVKNGAGIAGKDSEWIWILARDCEPPYPPQTF